MLKTQFKYKINLNSDQITDLSMAQYLLGPKINKKETDMLDTYRKFLTANINPSKREIVRFLKLRVKEQDCFFESGLVYTKYANDIGIPYDFEGVRCEFSIVGMFDLFFRISKEFSDGIVKIKHAMRADVQQMASDTVAPIGDMIRVLSSIGQALGFKQNVVLASSFSMEYNKNMPIYFSNTLEKGPRGDNFSCTALAFSLFNTKEIPVHAPVCYEYENYDMNQTCTLENMVILNSCHHRTEYEDIKYPEALSEVQIESVEESVLVKIEEKVEKKNEVKDEIHFGQLKLLISAFAFLYEVKQRGVVFENLYLLGCGTGHNNKAILYFLGPKYKYFLYDPVVSSVTYDDMRSQGYEVNVYPEMYTEERDFFPNSIAISDIRSELTDEAILYDNYVQWNWSRRLLAISMKFKIPSPDTRREKYYNIPTGTIFLQPYRGALSRETRIFHFDRGGTEQILVNDYKRKNDFFNCHLRNKGYTCYDCEVAKRILSRFEVPPYAQMIVPEKLHSKYAGTSGYERMMTIGKLREAKGKHWSKVHYEDLFVSS